jgi:hypothetical protein
VTGVPKSRGRRKSSPKKPVRRSPAPPRLSDRMMRDARRMAGGDIDVLQAEAWASDWLGDAGLAAPLGEREPEERLCLEVTGCASTTLSPHGLAALARVAPEASRAADNVLAESLCFLKARMKWLLSAKCQWAASSETLSRPDGAVSATWASSSRRWRM